MSDDKEKTNFWDFARENAEAICSAITVSVIAISIAAYHITKVVYGVDR